MLDWSPPDRGLICTVDRKYTVQHATKDWWIAYRFEEAEGIKLGEFHTIQDAQEACESDAQRKTGEGVGICP